MQFGETVFLALQIFRSAPAVICATRHRVEVVLERRRVNRDGDET